MSEKAFSCCLMRLWICTFFLSSTSWISVLRRSSNSSLHNYSHNLLMPVSLSLWLYYYENSRDIYRKSFIFFSYFAMISCICRSKSACSFVTSSAWFCNIDSNSCKYINIQKKKAASFYAKTFSRLLTTFSLESWCSRRDILRERFSPRSSDSEERCCSLARLRATTFSARSSAVACSCS